MDRTSCTEPQCLYKGSLYLYLYLYSPYGPYGLYRASVPVQQCTLPLPIPLLPLWTVRPVQCLSACTTVHFTFTYTSTPPMDRPACTEPQCLYNGALYLYLYLYCPYGPYGLYRASVPVQRCTLPLPIPLLPLCAVRPVQSLSACTTVHCTSFLPSSVVVSVLLRTGTTFLYLWLPLSVIITIAIRHVMTEAVNLLCCGLSFLTSILSQDTGTAGHFLSSCSNPGAGLLPEITLKPPCFLFLPIRYSLFVINEL